MENNKICMLGMILFIIYCYVRVATPIGLFSMKVTSLSLKGNIRNKNHLLLIFLPKVLRPSLERRNGTSTAHGTENTRTARGLTGSQLLDSGKLRELTGQSTPRKEPGASASRSPSSSTEEEQPKAARPTG